MAEIDLIARRLAELDERVVKIESLENGLRKLKEDMERSKREYLARRGLAPRRAKPEAKRRRIGRRSYCRSS